MKTLIPLVFISTCVILFVSSCGNESEKKIFLNAVEKYINTLDSTQFAILANEYKEIGIAESKYDVEKLFNIKPIPLEKEMIEIPIDMLDLSNLRETLNGTKLTEFDYEEIFQNIWQLRNNGLGFNSLSKFGLTAHSIKLNEKFAKLQLDSIEYVYPETYIDEFKKINANYSTDALIINYLKTRGSVAIQLTYNHELIKDKEHIGKIEDETGQTIDYPIRTIFDLGRLCPPICPDDPGGGMMKTNGLIKK